MIRMLAHAPGAFEVIATSRLVAALVGMAILSFLLGPGIVTALKGHGIWLAAGLLFSSLVWWYPAIFRRAKPGSWWAENVYSERRAERAAADWDGQVAGTWTGKVGAGLLAIAIAVPILVAALA